MFVFLLALGEDYNILVMTRIREEAGRMPLRQAVTRALEHTGSTVTSAGLVLAGTFGVFAPVVGDSPEAVHTRASSPLSRSASSWTPSSSAPCSSRRRSRSSAAGTGGHRRTAGPPKPPQNWNQRRHPAASHDARLQRPTAAASHAADAVA
jgi:MMPL family